MGGGGKEGWTRYLCMYVYMYVCMYMLYLSVVENQEIKNKKKKKKKFVVNTMAIIHKPTKGYSPCLIRSFYPSWDSRLYVS